MTLRGFVTPPVTPLSVHLNVEECNFFKFARQPIAKKSIYELIVDNLFYKETVLQWTYDLFSEAI